MTTNADSPRLKNAPLLGAFMFAHFTHHVSNSMLTPLLPLIRNGLDLTYAQSGFLVSAFTVSQGLSQLPIGALADRFPSRTVIAVGLVVTAACMVALGYAADYWQLLLALVGLGLVAGSYHAPAAKALAQMFDKQRLGAALGLHTTGGNFSFFATPLLAGGLVAVTETWRTPYLAFAIAPLVAGPFLMVTTPPRAPVERSARDGRTLIQDAVQVFRVVGPLLTAVVIFQTVFAALNAFLAVYLVDVRGFTPAAAVFAAAISPIGSLVGGPLGGWLSDRFGRTPVIIVSLVLLGPLLLALVAGPEPLLFPVLVLIGMVASMRMPVVEGLLLDRAPAERRAAILGSYYLVAQEVGGLGAPALGLLATAIGIEPAFSGVAIGAAALSALILVAHGRLR